MINDQILIKRWCGWAVKHTLSGKVNAPRSLIGSLKRLFSVVSPLLKAILMVMRVSGDGVGLMVDIVRSIGFASG